MRCSALGCQKKPGRNGVFCLACWRRLPEELRGPAAAQQARVWLGKKDGYLAEHSARPKMGEAGRGVGYV